LPCFEDANWVFYKIRCFKHYKNNEDFGTIITQRRFDIQLAGALKIQLKRGNNKTRFGTA
jgi:hypothetical protein